MHKLTTLSYSGGVQSHCLLEMLLRGDIPIPENFIILNADPGMEDPRTLKFVADAKIRCAEAGIEFITCPGPNLYRDIIDFNASEKTRFDNPPYWTKDAKGKRGKLKQGCTTKYKIQPMRQEIRRQLRERKIPIHGGVESWIGFALDEWHRCSESDVSYIKFRFPLIELKMDRLHVEGYYLKHNIPKPPRSVCAACFSNGLDYYKEIQKNEPEHFQKAILVDRAVRDLKKAGIRDEVFVSSTLKSLTELVESNFGSDDEDMKEHHCNSGVCFL